MYLTKSFTCVVVLRLCNQMEVHSDHGQQKARKCIVKTRIRM